MTEYAGDERDMDASRKAPKDAGRIGPVRARRFARSDPFQILEAEHELLRAQLRRTADAMAVRQAGRRRAVDTLRAVMRRHMDREDRALYPEGSRLFGDDGAVSVLRTDHISIEVALADLDARSATLPDQLDRVARLVAGHLAREEHVLFPMMAALLSGVEMDRLASQLRSGSSTPRIAARRS